MGGDMFVSLLHLFCGPIGISLLCEYFGVSQQQLVSWAKDGGWETRLSHGKRDFYRTSQFTVYCAWNETELTVSERNLRKTVAGQDILDEEEEEEEGEEEDAGCCSGTCFR
jgi:hypothetical protein